MTPATAGELDETGRMVEATGGRWRAEVLDQRGLKALSAPPSRSGAGHLAYDCPPWITVTARRFCDQQEMSLHTATGRSLP